MNIEWKVDPECIAMELGDETGVDINEIVAHLLLNNIIFLNTNWSQKEWPTEAQQGIVFLVNCNDFFGPYADCERITLDEIRPMYRMWQHEDIYGALAWCIAKRKEPPWGHRKFADRMKDLGYDVDALVRGELPEWSRHAT